MFDDESSWEQAVYHLRLLSLHGFTGYFPFRMKGGRIHRSTLKRLSEMVRPLLEKELGRVAGESPSRAQSGKTTEAVA